MRTNSKNEVTCDYCQIGKEANQIYTLRKIFAGNKRLLDILQIVSHRSIPATAPIKVCGLCASTLLSSTVVIEKTQQLVDQTLQGLPEPKKGKPNKDAEPSSTNTAVAVEEEGADAECEPEKASPRKKEPVNAEGKTKSTSMILNPTEAERASPRKRAMSTSMTLNPPAPKQKPGKAIASPRKQQKKLNDSLVDAVTLTEEVGTAKNKSFIALFGNSPTAIDVSDSDNEDDDEIDGGLQVAKKKTAKGFQCKLCEFVTKSPKEFKEHLRDQHAQQRPRIYDCTMCPKTFGILKTLKAHLTTHGVTNEKAKPVAKAVKSKAKATASQNEANPVNKVLENVQNAEYTFAINGSDGTKTSTPKAAEPAKAMAWKSLEFQCEICDSELKTVKAMKDHMKTAHEIENAKLFKCNVCDTNFKSNQSLKQHLKTIHQMDQNPLPKRKRIESVSSNGEEDMEIEPSSAIKKLQFPASPNKSAKRVEMVDKNTTTQSNGEATLTNAKSPANTSVKKTRAKKETSNVLEAQEAEAQTGSWENILISPAKKSPVKTKKAERESISINESNSPELEYLDEILSKNVTESPSKAGKRKLDDSLNHSTKKLPKSPAKTIASNVAETIAAEIVPPSPAKALANASASKKSKSMSAVIEIPDEINLDVRPHKKQILESDLDETAVLNCNLCDKTVSSRKRLDSHIQKKHAKSLKCPNCHMRTESSLEYIGHFGDSCNPTDAVPCGVKKCLKMFQNASFLTSHLKKKHEWS